MPVDTWVLPGVVLLLTVAPPQAVIAGFCVVEVLLARWWSTASDRRYSALLDEPAGRPRRALVPAEESPDSTGRGGG